MATADPEPRPRTRLVGALRGSLDDPTDAARLGCLLAARARFEAGFRRPPGGALAALPAPFDGIELPEAARDALDDIRAGGDARPAPSDLGGGYEATLDAADRDANGQYFTPEPVAGGLVRWALEPDLEGSDPPTVLDPAAGTGTFLHTAYRQLEYRWPDQPSGRLLDQLVGVDVDGIALQLAGLRLAAVAGEPAPGPLALHRRSFFDCVPPDHSRRGSADQLPTVDAVVGNPPFVRSEALRPGVEHFRRHLAAFGPAGESPLLDGDDALSRRSDAYVYFVTQATRFLRPGGRLAFVLPTKWLMSAYGEDLRRFLRERYRVHAIVGFEGRAFGDALVDTALLLAERDPDAGPESPMRFVTVADPTDADQLLAAVAAESNAGSAVERPQRSLTASGSLARHLEAPAELLELLEGPSFTRLDALADISRGTMTGANRFFFVDEETLEGFGIEAQFLRPAVKSLRSVARPTVESTDIDRWLVDVRPFVESTDGVDTASAVKEALASAGHEGLLGYIEHAEAAGWHEGRTCQSRPVWFDLGPLRAPAAFVPKLLRERVFAVRNAAGAVPSNATDGVWPGDDVHPGALLAVLNASAGRAAMEVTGRDEAGLLQLMTYETSSLPTLDVRRLAPLTAATVAEAGAAYAADPGDETLAALDRAVDDAFDPSLAPARLRRHVANLRRQRIDGGEPLTGTAD